MTASDIEARLEAALRRDHDAAPAPGAPTREQLFALAASTHDAPKVTRAGRAGWQRGLVAAAAVIALAVGTVAVLARDHVSGTDTRPEQLTSARQFLLAGARIATAAPFTAPRADQVDYARTAVATSATVRLVGGQPAAGPDHVEYTELWSPQTPGRPGLVRDQGQPDVPYLTLPDAFPIDLNHYAGLRELPTDDPQRLLADIASNVGNGHDPGDDTTVDAMKVMVFGGFFEQVLPPSLAAAVFTALAADPRITRQDGATDVLGRPAVAVGVTDVRGGRWEVLFDARTHQPIGTRHYTSNPGRSSGFGNDHVRLPGFQGMAIVRVATVDRVGQHPGK